MGTLQDQLKKVIDNWDNEDQPTTSQEKQVETNNTHSNKQTDRIVAFIRDNPGLKSMQINEMILKVHPDIPAENITSFLKQLADSHRLKRVDTGKLGHRGHTIFEYYANTEEERQAGVREDRRRQEVYKARVARAAMARAAKTKKAEKVQAKVKAKAKPKQVAVPTNAHIAAPNPAPVLTHTPAWNAKDALNGLTVLQARELYVELKAIFGA